MNTNRLKIIYILLLILNPWNLLIIQGHQTFSTPTQTLEQIFDQNQTNNLNNLFFHSPTINQIHQFFSSYFNYFSPRFLAFDGQWLLGTSYPPYIGSLLFPSFIFFIIGFFVILTHKPIRLNLLTIILLLLSPVLKSSLLFSFSLIYFASFGINFTVSKYKTIYIKLIIISLYFLSFLYYLDLQFFHKL